jgi:hypothetical protein
MFNNRTSLGKDQNCFTLTTITEAAGIYIVVIAYYADSACSKHTTIKPDIFSFTNKDKAEDMYKEISDCLAEGLK